MSHQQPKVSREGSMSNFISLHLPPPFLEGRSWHFLHTGANRESGSLRFGHESKGLEPEAWTTLISGLCRRDNRTTRHHLTLLSPAPRSGSAVERAYGANTRLHDGEKSNAVTVFGCWVGGTLHSSDEIMHLNSFSQNTVSLPRHGCFSSIFLH